MDEALLTMGLILLVTGCGGALDAVLKASRAGSLVAQAIATSSIPPLFVPLVIVFMHRTIQGPATASIQYE